MHGRIILLIAVSSSQFAHKEAAELHVMLVFLYSVSFCVNI